MVFGFRMGVWKPANGAGYGAEICVSMGYFLKGSMPCWRRNVKIS